MKSIKEQQTEYVLAHTDAVESYEAYAEKEEIAAAYEAGANCVIDALEEFMTNLNFGSNAAEMVYKDIKANIHKFIEQLKK